MHLCFKERSCGFLAGSPWQIQKSKLSVILNRGCVICASSFFG